MDNRNESTNTMKCLHCGWCCTSFEIPELGKRAGERCQYLTDGNLCSIYDKPERPMLCYKHDYPASVCPIGINELKLKPNKTLMRKGY
jgi:hypothetical protein